jgi:hypothetical protein
MLYADGITGTTFDMSYAAPTEAGVDPPSSNTTGAGAVAGEIRKFRNAGRLMREVDDQTGSYVRGEPVSFTAARNRLQRRAYVMAVWAKALAEISTLIAANPGTLSSVSAGYTGYTKQHRTI